MALKSQALNIWTGHTGHVNLPQGLHQLPLHTDITALSAQLWLLVSRRRRSHCAGDVSTTANGKP